MFNAITRRIRAALTFEKQRAVTNGAERNECFGRHIISLVPKLRNRGIRRTIATDRVAAILFAGFDKLARFDIFAGVTGRAA
jgi:hypothetical protein